MAAYTIGQMNKWNKDKFQAAIINAALEEPGILPLLPFDFWGTGTWVTYLWELSRMTIQEYDDGDTINETTGEMYPVKVLLKRLGGQAGIENFAMGTLKSAVSNPIIDQARALGAFLRNRVNVGISTTVAVGTNCTTKGVNAVIPGGRTPVGVGALKWDDTGKTLRYRAPGDTDYGDALIVAADLEKAHDYLMSKSKCYFIRLDFDLSDSNGAGDWEETTGTHALTFTTSKQMDGFMNLVQPDRRFYANGHATTPSADGDPITLAMINQALRAMKCPRREVVIWGSGREVDTVRALLGGAGGTKPSDWNGTTLSPDVVYYRNVPIIPDDHVPETQTVGATTNCTSLLVGRVNAKTGIMGYFGDTGSGRSTELRDDNNGKIPIFSYTRLLGEKETLDQKPLRTTCYPCVASRAYQALYQIHGIKPS